MSNLAAKNPKGLNTARLGLQPFNGEIIVTDQGPVLVEGPVSPSRLHRFSIDSGLRMFRQAEQQKKALEDIAAMPNGFVFIARSGNTVVGYVTFLTPDAYLCPGAQDVPGLLELGAIEVSSNWRRRGLGVSLLKEAFRNDKFEDYIIISTEYYWHWDLEKTGLSIWEYRGMLVDVLRTHGFEIWNSTDPDVLSHPANTFMVRVGKRVPAQNIEQVRNVCSLKSPA